MIIFVFVASDYSLAKATIHCRLLLCKPNVVRMSTVETSYTYLFAKLGNPCLATFPNNYIIQQLDYWTNYYKIDLHVIMVYCIKHE